MKMTAAVAVELGALLAFELGKVLALEFAAVVALELAAVVAVESNEDMVAELGVALATAGIELGQYGGGDRDRAIG